MTRTNPIEQDSAPRPKRRRFPAEYELRIVAEYDAASAGDKGAILRWGRLYHSHVMEWRQATDAGALEKRTTTAPATPARTPPRPRTTSYGDRWSGWRRRSLRSGMPRWRCWENTRALGSTLQECGPKDALEPVLHEAVEELAPYLGIVAACRITGRCRATHHPGG